MIIMYIVIQYELNAPLVEVVFFYIDCMCIAFVYSQMGSHQCTGHLHLGDVILFSFIHLYFMNKFQCDVYCISNQVHLLTLDVLSL